MGASPFLSFVLGAALATAAPWFPILCALTGICLAIYFLRFLRFRQHGRFLHIALLAAGAALVLLRPPSPAPSPGDFGYGLTQLDGYYISPPMRISSGYSQRFRITAGGPEALEELAVLSGRAFEVGERRRLETSVVTPRKRLNPGARAMEPFAFIEGAGPPSEPALTPRVIVNRARASLDHKIENQFAPPEAALVAAVTTGGKLKDAWNVRADFNKSGLAHLFSISGTHFGFFALMLFGVFRLALQRMPRLWLERMTERITPSEAAALLIFPFMIGYLLISGARVPSVRAFVMTGMFLIGLLLGRRGGWFPFLGLAASAIVIFDPQALAGLSFQMSFLAVLFIGMFIWPGEVEPPPYENPGSLTKLLSYTKGLFFITLAATAGTLPLVALYFHRISLVSPAANMIVTPLVSMVLVPLSLLGALSHLLSGHYVTWPLVEATAKATLWLAHAFASVPMASVRVSTFPPALLVLYYGGFALWFLGRYQIRNRGGRWKQWVLMAPVLSIAAAAAFIYFSSPAAKDITGNPSGAMRVTFLDTGRADAAVVELPHAEGTLVVDAGRGGREVANYLRMRGIHTIDALILSHGHADHTGGARYLSRAFRVREIWDAGWIEYPQDIPQNRPLASIPRRTLRRGDLIEGSGFQLLVLHPYDGYETPQDGNRAGNDRSLVFRLSARHSKAQASEAMGERGEKPEKKDISFMFTGDIGADAARNINQIPPKWLRANVLKAPHHGHNARALMELLASTGAENIVLTNHRVYPSTAHWLSTLKERPPKMYLTGIDGAVSFKVKGGKLSTSAYNKALLVRWPSPRQEISNLARMFSLWPEYLLLPTEPPEPTEPAVQQDAMDW